MYQTYVVAYDGNWLLVVSACSKLQASRKALVELWARGFNDLRAGDIEVTRVKPGQVHSIVNHR